MSADSEASNKRKASSPPRENSAAEDAEAANGGAGLKKVKTLNGSAAAGALTVVQEQKSQALVVGSNLPAGVQRTSNLPAPTIELTGHGAAVFACKFNPSGTHVASGSYDKNIFLWQVFDEVKNVAVLTGHKSAVTDLCWSRDGDFLYSASADKLAYVFDVDRGVRVKTLKEHSSYVNSISVSRRGDPFIVTGSDDGNVMVWDQRVKAPVKVLTNEQYQVTAVAFSDDSNQVFSGGIDNDISVWDWRKDKIVYTLSGHTDTITGLSLSPDGSYLLSNGMDNTVRQWDVRPFATSRLVRAFVGARHDLQKNLLRCSWSPDGKRVSAGSADRLVYIWDVASTRVLYRLPGHNGSVTEVDFHPNEPIIVSAGLDKRLFLGEVDPTIA